MPNPMFGNFISIREIDLVQVLEF